jgi:hypothetical protein
MTFPITFSLPQIVLLLIVLIGVFLLITAFTRYRYKGVRWGRGISGLILIVLALSLLWAVVTVQTYLGLTGETKVAHVHATKIANTQHQMSVELTLFDNNGHVTSDNTYLIQGDEWMVQGNILKFPAWLNILGLHSGYKLTRLEGRYDDIDMENKGPHTAIALNGGDDNFYSTAHAQQSWMTPIVDAYGNAAIQTTGSYDVLVTQDALITKPTS